MYRTVITGSGAYIPPVVQSNKDFFGHAFFDENGEAIPIAPEIVVQKFKQITGIEERRYTTDDLKASDIGAMAAKLAIEDSGVDPESIDQIIVAHNFGNVLKDSIQTDIVPALASHVKHKLGIRNPNCIAYDVIFGCPGWIQGVMQSHAYFQAGMAKKTLVIGAETLSRVVDMYDRDSMIFSDGAGATIQEWKDVKEDGPGILSTAAQSHSLQEVDFINMGCSYKPGSDPNTRFIKMQGRKVYEYAMTHVPAAMKECLDKSGLSIHDLKKVFIHQANEKMDEGIIKRLYKLYGIDQAPSDVMPMSIHWLGNSSVATVPTLYDLVIKGKAEGHSLKAGDLIMFASVGAGMNINAICYRF
ncbi:MAG: 3-oxoacyl-ACP synthase III family protein [Chitinophagaceae bacterium]